VWRAANPLCRVEEMESHRFKSIAQHIGSYAGSVTSAAARRNLTPFRAPAVDKRAKVTPLLHIFRKKLTSARPKAYATVASWS
jgi:hypothetical protein